MGGDHCQNLLRSIIVTGKSLSQLMLFSSNLNRLVQMKTNGRVFIVPNIWYYCFIDGEIILGRWNQGDGIPNKYRAFLFLLLYNSVDNQMLGVNNIYRSGMSGVLQTSCSRFQLLLSIVVSEVPPCFWLVCQGDAAASMVRWRLGLMRWVAHAPAWGWERRCNLCHL